MASKLERDFIRGFFDGDGCIYIRPDKKSRIFSIYSVSRQFLLDLKKSVEQQVKIKMHYYKQGNNGYVVSVMKQNDIDALYDYLYKNSKTFLERKRTNFLPTPPI